MSDTKPRWRRPDDTSDELEVGDRIVAICRWSDRQGQQSWRHVVVLTVQETGPPADSEGLGLCVEDCECWMPESEFLRMFGPEVQADTPPDAPPWQGHDGWEGRQ